ncbi:MAG: ABC transporter permease [Tissierellia bacterium]|nr:ABC transporter permease [Tissierellia bacterium]
MKVLDYLTIVKLNIFRDKKKKFLILIFVFCTIISLLILSFRSNFFTYINNSITKSIGFRTLVVGAEFEMKNNGLDKLKTIEHVVDVYDSQIGFISLESSFKNDHFDGYITFLYGGKYSLPQNIVGSSLNENDQGVAICPINFYPSDSINNMQLDQTKILDGHQLLNDTFDVTYYSHKYEGQKIVKDKTFTKKIKIIGLYNNNEVMTLNNECYISPTDLNEMISVSEIKTNTDIPDGEYKEAFGFMVIVDNLKNVERVSSALKEAGFVSVDLQNHIDSNLLNIIMVSSNITVGLVLFTVLMMNASYIKKKVQNEAIVIGILRAGGYQKNNINWLYLIELFFTNLISYLLGLSIFMIIYLISKNTILKPLHYLGVGINISIKDLLLSFLLIVIVSMFISIYHIVKKTKCKITELIRSEE